MLCFREHQWQVNPRGIPDSTPASIRMTGSRSTCFWFMDIHYTAWGAGWLRVRKRDRRRSRYRFPASSSPAPPGPAANGSTLGTSPRTRPTRARGNAGLQPRITRFHSSSETLFNPARTLQPMSKKFRIAGINFDHFHMGDLLRMVHEHPDAEIVGICDEQPERMARGAAELRHSRGAGLHRLSRVPGEDEARPRDPLPGGGASTASL